MLQVKKSTSKCPSKSAVHFKRWSYCVSLIALLLGLQACKAGFASSIDASLSRLSISDVNLSPSFDTDTLEYTDTVSVNVTSIVFNARTSSEGATMELDGVDLADDTNSSSQTLAVGENTFEITVLAEDEFTEQTYVFVITRQQDTDDDANLTSLTLTDIDFDFFSGTLEYDVETNYLVNQTRVLVDASNSEAALFFAGDSELVDGKSSVSQSLTASSETILSITVTATDDSTEQIYSVTVDRGGEDDLNQNFLKAAAPGVGDEFGHSVAFSDNTLAVGLPGASEVIVFNLSGDLWGQTASVKPTVSEPHEGFGSSVALVGSTLVVGAPGSDVIAGRVFIVTGSGWDQIEELSLASSIEGDRFGEALSLQDDILMVGAPGATLDTGVNGGVVFEYTLVDAIWTQGEPIVVDDSVEGDDFGAALQLNYSTELAIGAPGRDLNKGAVYVVEHTGGTWVVGDPTVATIRDEGDKFGTSLVIQDDVLVVGAPGEQSSATGVDGLQADKSQEDAGAVYIFSRKDESDTSWGGEDTYLKATTAGAMGFGSALAMTDSMLAVGAPLQDVTAGNSGAVYLFARDSEGGWPSAHTLKAVNNTEPSQNFGNVLAFIGDTLVVGAEGEDSSVGGINPTPNDGANNSGAVYVIK
ncbi:MAG: hypothetical protein ACI9Y1_001244 [Lentisphaeria bacterium]|jgi:hypothetical protein